MSGQPEKLPAYFYRISAPPEALNIDRFAISYTHHRGTAKYP